MLDVCSLEGYSSIEFIYRLDNKTIPRKYADLVKEQLKIIITNWNSYSFIIEDSNCLLANDDLTIISHEINGCLVGEYKIIYE